MFKGAGVLTQAGMARTKHKDKAVNTVADMKEKGPAKKGGAKKGTRAGAKPKKAKKGGSAQASAGAGDKLPGKAAIQDILGRTDQIGTILSKGLDLAEAGIGLGMNLIGKLGSMAQDQVIGNIAKTVMPGQYGAQNAPERPVAPPYRRGEDEPAGDAAEGGMCIVNRRPLFPGSAVEISFSINNDSPAHARKVHIEIDGFTGSAHGWNIPPELFSIRPADMEIAPMDFEKFVLAGAIPQDAPEDSYNGWLRLAGEEGLKMPVILAVTSRG